VKLCYPVNYVVITNGYTKEHPAIDLGWHITQDIPIYACYNGVVSRIFTDNAGGGGLTLYIEYDNGFRSYFMHLSKILVKVGDKVSQMQQVAVMGNTGWSSTGTHLHFILYNNDKNVNPLDFCYLYPNQKVAQKDKDKVKYYERGGIMKFKVGDNVIVSGNLYTSSSATSPSGKVENKVTQITRVVEGALHPYNTTGDLGWMNESDIKLYEEPNLDYKVLYEEEVIKNRQLQEQINLLNQKINQAISILQ